MGGSVPWVWLKKALIATVCCAGSGSAVSNRMPKKIAEVLITGIDRQGSTGHHRGVPLRQDEPDAATYNLVWTGRPSNSMVRVVCSSLTPIVLRKGGRSLDPSARRRPSTRLRSFHDISRPIHSP